MSDPGPELNRWYSDIRAGRFTSLRDLLYRMRWFERVFLIYPPKEREP